MPSANARTAERLLDIMAEALRALSERELQLLLDGKGKLVFISAGGDGGDEDVETALTDAAREVAKQLAEIESREAAEDLIAAIEHPRRRDVLVRAAQLSRVRVGTKDSAARIGHKLIDATVGARLRSRAFREVPF